MSLRLKITLWMATVTAFFALLTWGAQRLVVIPSFTALEHGIAREAVTNLTANIKREGENLRVRCLEWSNWDDAYNFVQTGDRTFTTDNLNDDWFSRLHINVMLFCDTNGKVVWGEVHSAAQGSKLGDVADASAFLSLGPESVRAVCAGSQTLNGIAITSQGPMLISGHSIHRSDRSGPSVGAVILGSFLRDRDLAEMSNLRSGSVRAWDLRGALPPPVGGFCARLEQGEEVVYAGSDSDSYSAFILLKNLAGTPALFVQVVLSRDITNRGMAACRFALIAVLLVGLLMQLLVVAVLDRSVLRPVLRIIDSVAGIGRTNDLKLRVEGAAPGELGILLTEFNRMMDRLAEDHARREEAEERLRHTEEKYRRIFEDSVVGLFQSTPDGRQMHVNNAFARLLGYTDAEEFKRCLSDVATDVYVRPGQRVDILRRIEAHGPLSAFEIQFRRKDGSTCWVSLTARVDRDEAGRIRFYEGSIEDIAQRRQAQEQLHKLSRAVDQSPASIVITDPNGTIEYVNRKFVETTGYTTAETVGQKPSVLKSGLMPDRVYAELWQTIVGGREWRGELHNRKKNGDLYWEWASVSPLLDADGKVTHFLAVKEDITHRKEADATLRRTLEQVERFNRLAIGRERRIIELKAAINELLARLGEAPRYQVGLCFAPGCAQPAEVVPA